MISFSSRKSSTSGGIFAILVGLAALAWHQGGTGETPQPAPAPFIAAEISSDEEAEGIIFERQQLMLQLDKDAKVLGQIVAGAVPPTKLTETTRSIAQTARDSALAFEAVVPGGRSKPEVWSNHTEFLEDMNTFARKAEEMAKAGESGNLNAVTNLMIEALPCKQCHDRYREPKSP